MGFIDDFISSILGSQRDTPLAGINESERDGNADDLLLRTEQSANALSISGGTTLTDLSPTAAIDDLNAGKISGRLLLWLALLGLAIWWLMRKQ